MSTFFNKIIHSKYLNIEEIIKLKLVIVNILIVILTLMIIPFSLLEGLSTNYKIIFLIIYGVIILMEVIFSLLNKIKFAIHISLILLCAITGYIMMIGSSYYGYILFYIVLVAIVFFQDIVTYIVYGFLVTSFGVYYVLISGEDLVGVNSIDSLSAIILYIVILVGFFLCLLAQVILSQTHYNKLSKEWIKMNILLEKYQEFSMFFTTNIALKNDEILPYKDERFINTIKEICQFTNEFFVENGDEIISSVELYFELHNKSLLEILEDESYSSVDKRKAIQLNKFVINQREDMMTMLFNLSTMFMKTDEYDENRYCYDINSLTDNIYQGYFVVAVLYAYLANEPNQFNHYGIPSQGLTHTQINELFLSRENNILSSEQIDFYVENEELFIKHFSKI